VSSSDQTSDRSIERSPTTGCSLITPPRRRWMMEHVSISGAISRTAVPPAARRPLPRHTTPPFCRYTRRSVAIVPIVFVRAHLRALSAHVAISSVARRARHATRRALALRRARRAPACCSCPRLAAPPEKPSSSRRDLGAGQRSDALVNFLSAILNADDVPPPGEEETTRLIYRGGSVESSGPPGDGGVA